MGITDAMVRAQKNNREGELFAVDTIDGYVDLIAVFGVESICGLQQVVPNILQNRQPIFELRRVRGIFHPLQGPAKASKRKKVRPNLLRTVVNSLLGDLQRLRLLDHRIQVLEHASKGVVIFRGRPILC